jgi:hypothetical protein
VHLLLTRVQTPNGRLRVQFAKTLDGFLLLPQAAARLRIVVVLVVVVSAELVLVGDGRGAVGQAGERGDLIDSFYMIFLRLRAIGAAADSPLIILDDAQTIAANSAPLLPLLLFAEVLRRVVVAAVHLLLFVLALYFIALVVVVYVFDDFYFELFLRFGNLLICSVFRIDTIGISHD